MAEVAGIFHWPLSELKALDIDELADWRDRAVSWWNKVNGKGK